MNVRKPIDYSVMYAELDEILSKNLPQMEEIHAIGRAICKRPEKGAAVMAAEYLQANYPERSGFSPRNVRRMRDFYRAYENDQSLLQLALNIGWTLNVVIMEAELTRTARKWYLEQVEKLCWTKSMLQKAICENVFAENSKTSVNKTVICNIRNASYKLSITYCSYIRLSRGQFDLFYRKIFILQNRMRRRGAKIDFTEYCMFPLAFQKECGKL